MTEEGPSDLALLITAMQSSLTAILQNLVWGLHVRFRSCLLCFVKGTCSKMSVGRAQQTLHRWEH